MAGVRAISSIWPGKVVADMEVSDSALGEVEMARAVGATAIIVAGQAPKETRDLFIASCKTNKLIPMVDMIGVNDPIKVIRQLKSQSNVVILHKGRNEETARGKVIEYRHVKRIKYKYDIIISVVGGVDIKEACNSVFNGANIIVANLVQSGDLWEGIPINSNIAQLANQFLTNIE